MEGVGPGDLALVFDDDVKAGPLDETARAQVGDLASQAFSKNAAVAATSMEGKLKWLSFIVAVMSVMESLLIDGRLRPLSEDKDQTKDDPSATRMRDAA